MSRIVVIGAGAMGLAAAHRAVQLGHEVDLIESDSVPGGMAAHFDFGGLSIERFYHFVCKSDDPTFSLMRELGIGDKMKWRSTTQPRLEVPHRLADVSDHEGQELRIHRTQNSPSVAGTGFGQGSLQYAVEALDGAQIL
jgi:protoporphyrinogen oxidase